jgi:mannose-6-phosphate isomerase
MRIHLLENAIQKYPWGSSTGLSECLGLPNPEGGPMAELWMGAHPKAPSLALVGGEKRPLDALIAEDPEGCLGKAVRGRFGDALPFLFKVLSADSPLSIQAHPSKRKAERGFDRENLAGIPLDAPDRNYRDRNHKPEMVTALTRFEGLFGFRPIDQIIANVKIAAPRSFPAYVSRLERNPGRVELSVLFYSLISLDAAEKKTILARVVANIDEALAKGLVPPAEVEAFRWVSRLQELYPDDIGAIAPLALNFVALEPGQSLFAAPGELHAYLKGTSLELMANSDNVIRGALTGKHIDVPELISVLTFNSAKAEPFTAQAGGVEELFPLLAPDFRLSRISHAEGGHECSSEGPEILLCTSGKFGIAEASGGLELARGDAAFVRADAGRYRVSGGGVLYRAFVPLDAAPLEELQRP